jgi:hypothetical protein
MKDLINPDHHIFKALPPAYDPKKPCSSIGMRMKSYDKCEYL